MKVSLTVGAVGGGAAHIESVANTSSFGEQRTGTFGFGARQSLVYSYRQADSSGAFFDVRAEMLMKCGRWKFLFPLPNLHMTMVSSVREDSPLDVSDCPVR